VTIRKTQKENDNMNELQAYREVKKIMKYGVSKEVAKEIVEVAMSVTNGDLTRAIDYALTLTYGIKIIK
jgi:hypothetical protein